MFIKKISIFLYLASLSFVYPSILLSQGVNLRDSLPNYLNTITDDSLKFKTYIELTDLWLYDNPDSALYYIDLASITVDTSNNRRYKGYLINRRAAINWSKGNLETALELQTEALQIANEIKDSTLIAKCQGNIATLFSAVGDDLMAVRMTQKTIPYYQKTDNGNRLIASYNNIGKSYLSIGLIDSAIMYLNKALDLVDPIHEWMKPIVLLNQAEAYFMNQELSEAKSLLETQLLISHHYKDQRAICRSHQLLAEIALQEKNISLAARHMDIAIPIAEKSNVKELKYICYYTEAKVLEAQGSYKEALKANNLAKAYEDSVINQSVKNELTFYNFKKINEEINLIQQESEINKLKAESQLLATWALGAILVLIVIVLIIVFIALRNIKLRNQQLTEKNSQIAYQKHKLERQSEELKEINQSKDRIISIITHDFRSPLASLKSLISMLDKEMISDKEFRSLIPELNKSMVSTTLLLESLIIWAKEQINSHVLNQSPLSIKKLLKDVLLILNDQIEDKNISIEENIENSCQVLGDSSVLQIVLRNIISNAIKFSHPDGSIKITTRAKESMVEIEITDQGIGMDDDMLGRLFTKSVQSKAGTQGEKGSGIGLLICKEFITKSNGDIEVNSNPGSGTTFKIMLPKAKIGTTPEKITLN